jgi:hypothetical protein
MTTLAFFAVLLCVTYAVAGPANLGKPGKAASNPQPDETSVWGFLFEPSGGLVVKFNSKNISGSATPVVTAPVSGVAAADYYRKYFPMILR